MNISQLKIEKEIRNRLIQANKYLILKEYHQTLDKLNIITQFKTSQFDSCSKFDVNIYSLQGFINLKFGEFIEAQKNFQKALSIDPLHFTTLLRRCQLYIKIKKLQEAAKDLSNAFIVDPQITINSSQLIDLEDAIDLMSEIDPKKYQIKKILEEFTFIQKDEQKSLNFTRVVDVDAILSQNSSIYRSTNGGRKGMKKSLDFAFQNIYQYQKDQQELNNLDVQVQKSEQYDKQQQQLLVEIKQQQQNEKQTSIFKYKSQHHPMSILISGKRSKFAHSEKDLNLQKSKDIPIDQMLKTFDIKKVKNLERVKICRSKQKEQLKQRGVMFKSCFNQFVNKKNQMNKSILKFGSKNIASLQKINLTEQPSFKKINDIDGKTSVKKINNLTKSTELQKEQGKIIPISLNKQRSFQVNDVDNFMTTSILINKKDKIRSKKSIIKFEIQ